MRAFVAVVSRRADRVSEDRVLEAARRSLPFRTDGPPEERWTDESGRILVAAWSNEPEQPDRPLLTTTAAGAVGFSGYLHGAVPGPHDLASGPAPRLGGVWSLLSASQDGITALTCASGAEVVFYAETPDVVVVGNRALLVHLVANPSGPEPDLVGLSGVLNSGYCVTTRTAFAGVRALSAGERVRCDGEGVLSVAAYDVGTTVASATDVAEALVASVAPLRTIDHPVRLGLTGGRDSRLLVALLTSAGVPVTTYTAGMPEDPDVVVAQEVAERLGVAHKVSSPRGAKVEDETITFDVRSRLREAVVMGEGMLSAYDRVGRIDDSYNAHTVPFGGSGGEILRAYYAGSVKDMDDSAAVVRYMRGRLYSTTKHMTSTARTDYEADTEPWMVAASDLGASALEDFYVRQRAGRWTGAARSSASIGSLARRPYLDHLVVDAVRRVPLRERTSERLIADLLDALAPSLKNVRFAGRRWKFDLTPPTDPTARAEWKGRSPVQGEHGDQASFNWRTDLPEVRQELAAIIASAPAVFWELAHHKRVSDFLTPLDGRSRAETVKLWHLATVADALANDFYASSAKFDSTASEVVAGLATEHDERPVVTIKKLLRRFARRVRDRVKNSTL
jgi:hypothetical protein